MNQVGKNKQKKQYSFINSIKPRGIPRRQQLRRRQQQLDCQNCSLAVLPFSVLSPVLQKCL